MNILALDPSSKAIGWATSDDARGRSSGVYRPLDWRSQDLDEFARHKRMCGRAGMWLADMLTERAPEVVVIETAVPIRNSRCLERLAGALMLVLWTREFLTVPVQPNVWQHWAKRNVPERLTRWQADEKPDDVAAELMLDWFEATGMRRVRAA